MPDKTKDKVTRKDRQDRRVEKLTEKRTEEAKAAGVDLSTPGPMTTSRKAEIDTAINKGVEGEMREGLKKIQAVRKAPEVDVPEKPKLDLDIKDVRKERRAKIANVMYALGQGLSGEAVDPFKYTRPQKEERLAQYKDYKDASKAAKQKVEEFDAAYINEQLDYLKSQLNNPDLSDLKRQQIKKQIEKTEAEIKYKNRQTSLLGKDKDDKDNGNMAKLTQDLSEDSRTSYNIPIEEAKQREKQAKIDEATSMVNAELQQAELDLANMGTEGTKKREIFDKPKRNNLLAKIESLKQQKQEIIDSFGGENTPITTPKTETKTKSLLDEAIEEYK